MVKLIVEALLADVSETHVRGLGHVFLDISDEIILFVGAVGNFDHFSIVRWVLTLIYEPSTEIAFNQLGIEYT